MEGVQIDLRNPIQAVQAFRFDPVQPYDLKPSTIPI
jgi:hypothetical protein